MREVFKVFESEISNKKIISITIPNLNTNEHAVYGKDKLPITIEYEDKSKCTILCGITLIEGEEE